MMKAIPFRALWVLLGILSMLSCTKDDPLPPVDTETGKANIRFTHYVDGNPLQIDTTIYVNAAGNAYQINEVQYFISDVVFIADDNSEVVIDDVEDIHYIDHDIPSTMTWAVADPIKAGNYKAIRFTFGINAAKNISYMFVNPPERDMFWPDFLGGGYHYMKLNGKWIDTTAALSPFNFHLGIGQLYDANDSIIGFVQNYFSVTLTGVSFGIAKDAVTDIEIRMNIASWFDTPHVWDHDTYGGYIMQNQAAMLTGKENGYDVFSLH